ncbi:MAG: hypothetical protein L0220_18100, partial [Acidobacteria bacterium]|nr:hypothetical protein [Acidobacteriota bacterium]
MIFRRSTIGLLAILLTYILTTDSSLLPVTDASVSLSNWPQWRGPESQGISTEKNLPTEWSETKNVLWKTPVQGRGFSQPVIWDNQVFLTTDVEGGPAPGSHKPPTHMAGDKEFTHPEWDGIDKLHTFKVLSLDRDNGKILWEKTAYEGTVYDYRHKRGNYAAPTPVTDGKYVWAYFGSEGLHCYDFKGELIWKKSLGPIGT